MTDMPKPTAPSGAAPNTPPNTFDRAHEVLKQNDRGMYTIPAHGLYPHQWLWDSCFTALGWRHVDVERAKLEVLSLLRGQWRNGMIPHMIFTPGSEFARDHNIWRSWVSPFAPDDIITSGITQPPMLAEAIVQIGAKLELVERRSWYRQVFPGLLSYHQWLYSERDPHQEGLALQIHPWETGFDNTPPWMSELHAHLLPWWIRLLRGAHLDGFTGVFRRDTHYVPAEQRYSNIDALALYDAQRRLRRKSYDIDKILDHSLFAIEDLAFNSIFVRANQHLVHIAASLRIELPSDLLEMMGKTAKSLNDLWDPYTEMFYSRDFITHRLLKEPSVATLLPLYAGTISKEKAAMLVGHIENEHMFGPAFPLPSTPLSSPWFNAQRYWQGPTWLNINWLVADGLRRYGYHDHAEALIESSLEMLEIGGGSFAEYYNPIVGNPLGAHNFSWTAAIAMDWLKRSSSSNSKPPKSSKK